MTEKTVGRSTFALRRPFSRSQRGKLILCCSRRQNPEAAELRIRKGDDETLFAPLDRDSPLGVGGLTEDAFGPLGMLLIGFAKSEYEVIKELMDSMDAHMVPLYCASEATLNVTLAEAFENGLQGFCEAPSGSRRTIIMSGMYTAEVLDVVASYRDLHLPHAVFAAAVPNSWCKNIADLLRETYEDDDAVQQGQLKG